jgi:hypothetical protein
MKKAWFFFYPHYALTGAADVSCAGGNGNDGASCV